MPDARCYDRAMEGAAELLVVMAAIVAVGLASAALVLVLRRDGRSAEPSPGSARTAELERFVRQLSQRLETVERDLDGQQGSTTGSNPSPGTLRTAGVALSHLGLVRFDAFEDAGGSQSFALALIDDDGDGIVLTSLHSRQATRLYVKSIRRGVADAPLSGEEVQAMRNAGISPTL